MTAAVTDTVEPLPDASWSDQVVAWTLRNWMALVNAIVLVACSVAVLTVLHPDLLLTNTTTAGGDTGAHVWWPAFLRDFLLPEGKVAGWSKDFYAGFPAGQFYFPIPALMIVLLDVVLPYNIAFKLITAVGAVALPASAFVFGRGLRLRFPAPLFMGIATLAFLFFRGDPRTTAPFANAAFNQRIMGGTLASTLAGEFSFTIALCFALCFLGVFALTLRGGRRPVWAALLLAATILSHVIVGIFVAVAALVVLAFRFFLDPEHREGRFPGRRQGLLAGGLLLATLLVGVATISVWWTLPVALAATAAGVWFALGDRNRMVLIAAAVGGVGALLTALWSIPLVARFPYTSNMAYEKIITNFDLSDPADGLNLYLFPNYGTSGIFPWVFLFGLVGLFVAIAFWRPGVLVLATITLLMGVLFVQWPELHAWNLRFLPFWYLGWLFLAAVGLADIVRIPGLLATMPSRPAPTDDGDDDPLPAEVEAKVRRERRVARRVALGLTAGMTLVVAFGGVVMAANNTGFLGFWAQYNYTGYEWVSEQTAASAGDVELPKSGPCTNPPKQANKYNNSGKAYPEYASIMKTMGELPPGRALWEPSAAIDKYGTTLALMLLPYCTDHRIASSEGLYFEAAGTTAYHFITVSQVSSEPSNPMRFPGIPTPYGRPGEDFDLGVRHLQMLGIRYYMAQSDTAKGFADVHPSLRLVADIPDRDQIAPLGWKVYEVQDAPLVEPLQYAPVVVADQGSSGWQQSGSRWLTDWFNDPEALDRLLVADGPREWARADAADARGVAFGDQLPEVTVSDVREREQSVSFRVSRTGVPVLVKTSYYPNWKVSGAKGVYRASPNFMVVVPTSEEVTLRFERAGVDWLGMLLTLFGLVALVPLARWKPRAAFADEGIDINADLDPFATPDEPDGSEAPAVDTPGHDSDDARPAPAASDVEADEATGVPEPEPDGADDDRN